VRVLALSLVTNMAVIHPVQGDEPGNLDLKHGKASHEEVIRGRPRSWQEFAAVDRQNRRFQHIAGVGREYPYAMFVLLGRGWFNRSGVALVFQNKTDI